MDLTAHPRNKTEGFKTDNVTPNVSEHHHHPQHKILQNPNFREDIIPGQNANPKRVKKITIWVGEKKGREEEEDDDDDDDDDDARMLYLLQELLRIMIPTTTTTTTNSFTAKRALKF
jgi:hypothetical protein